MKNLLTTLAFLFVSLSSLAQLELTLVGDPKDSTLIARKSLLEAKGYKVHINPKSQEKEETGDLEFIKKWTNQQLPTFEFSDIEGNTISSGDLQGKYVHINFWSVTCRPCIQEFPELDQLKEKYGDDLVYLAFAPESESKVKRILQNNPLAYQTIAETDGFFEELGIGGYPKNFFVDPQGRIVKVTDGTHYKSEMKDGKLTMIPDNFKIYDQIIKEMIPTK